MSTEPKEAAPMPALVEQPWATLTVDDAEVIIEALDLMVSKMPKEREAFNNNSIMPPMAGAQAHYRAGHLVQKRAEAILRQFRLTVEAHRKAEEASCPRS